MLDGVTTAWFEAPSLMEGASLAARAVELSADIAVDVRATGVRVRLDSDEHAATVSASASALGLVANPAVLQQVSVVIETADPAAVGEFWQRVFDYVMGDGDGLMDPLQRDPSIRFRLSPEERSLRNRIHLDVVRPAAAVEQAGLGEAFGPYDVCHADPDGNEVDVVPADPLGDTTDTADWQAVFGAVACYRTTSPAQQRDLAAAAGALAHEAGFPLMIDLRPGLVIFDSGKDQWEADAHGLDVDFIDLARRIQAAAHELGAVADAGLPRFAQLFIDAADVDAVRDFWVTALGYVRDHRDGCTDIVDPRRVNPVLLFQELDATDTARRQQRNRIHFELAVPADQAKTRVTTTLAAGGQLLDESDGHWLIADPEGNELVITSAE